jgi:hypothetical protein
MVLVIVKIDICSFLPMKGDKMCMISHPYTILEKALSAIMHTMAQQEKEQ